MPRSRRRPKPAAATTRGEWALSRHTGRRGLARARGKAKRQGQEARASGKGKWHSRRHVRVRSRTFSGPRFPPRFSAMPMDSFFAFFTLVTAEPASRNSTHVLQPLQPRVDQRITPSAHEWKRPPRVSKLCPLATPSAAIPELTPTATAACLGTVRPASWASPGPIWTFAATAGRGRRSTAWVPPMRRSATGAAMIAPAEGAASSATARTASACFMCWAHARYARAEVAVDTRERNQRTNLTLRVGAPKNRQSFLSVRHLNQQTASQKGPSGQET